ncbi:MAG: hypothetical protein CSA38_02050 [Flavobacteriales bacterium]|nr:MAG: hypothetical protein CSA38_02050 [Flavobacteriales bacterium]
MLNSTTTATLVNNSSEVANQGKFQFQVQPFLKAFKVIIQKGNQKTHAFGRNRRIAKKNAIKMFNRKYNPTFSL